MKIIKSVGAVALLTGSLAAVGPVSAAVLDANPFSLAAFCANSGAGTDPLNSYRRGIFTYTCYTGGPSQTPDPLAQAGQTVAAPTLDANAGVSIQAVSLGGVATGTLNINTLGLQEEGSISYFVEITPNGDATDEPDIRFTITRLTNEIQQQNSGNASTRKQITGQNNAIVNPATYTADLVAGVGGTPSDNCGVCRKFLITDTYTRNVNGSTDEDDWGVVQSMTNTFEVALPLPAPLALVSAGLLALGFANRRRKA
jgi:hypothetical protein